jgi:chromodomain-helicase-DNA-binding protein 4
LDDSPVKEKKRKSKSRSKSEDTDSDFGGSDIGNDTDDMGSLSSQDLENVATKLPDRSVDQTPSSSALLTNHNKSGSAERYRARQQDGPFSPTHNHVSQKNGSVDNQLCGLCGTSHGPEECYMTESSENLVSRTTSKAIGG